MTPRSSLVCFAIACICAALCGCGGGQPECFECGLTDEWARADERRAQREAAEVAQGEETTGADDGEGCPDRGDACHSSVTPAPTGSIPCGEQTCGPSEYCLIECLCCGTRVPDPAEAAARYTCVTIPEGCDPAAICGCEGLHEGRCAAERRTVETPCA